MHFTSRRMAIVAVLAAALLAAGSAVAAERGTRAPAAREQTPVKKKTRTDATFGREGDSRKVNRVIRIEMSDAMRFFPDQIKVKRGDTVRFIIRNRGQLAHEMVLGTMDDLKHHAAEMKKTGEMMHEGAHVAHVRPGATGRIVWQFTKAGEFYYACLIPGHFDAGMIGTVVVR